MHIRTCLCLAWWRDRDRDRILVPSPCPSRWLVWWARKNIMHCLLQEHHPLGFNFPVSPRWPYSLFACSYFQQSPCCFILDLTSCSETNSSCCTSLNLFYFPWGFGAIPRYHFPGLYPFVFVLQPGFFFFFYKDVVLSDTFYQSAWKKLWADCWSKDIQLKKHIGVLSIA